MNYRELKTVADVRQAQAEGLALEWGCGGGWVASFLPIDEMTHEEIQFQLNRMTYRAILPAAAEDGLEVFDALVEEWLGEHDPVSAMYADELAVTIAAYREAKP